MALALQPHNVLAFGAHPDDLEVGAGGFLSRLVLGGASVTMVIASVPTHFETRCREAAEGAGLIGAQHTFLFADSRRLEDVKMYEIVSRFDQLMAEHRPDLVLTHPARDRHNDHLIVHRATIAALRRTACSALAYRTAPGESAAQPAPGQCFVDITPQIETKLAAIAAHASQKIDVESRRVVARAAGYESGFEYAEAFEVLRLRVAGTES